MTLKNRKQAIFFLGVYQNSLITGAAGPARHLGLADGKSTILHMKFLYLKIKCFSTKDIQILNKSEAKFDVSNRKHACLKRSKRSLKLSLM